MAKNKFNPKDTKYSKLPKSAAPKSPNEPDEYEDHSYSHREVRPDGATVYYYDNGVKAIHHPKKTGSDYHRKASEHHSDKAQELISAKKTESALSHLRARIGHRMAAKKKAEDESKVSKLYKDFGGADSGAGDIVAVASDPGIFTETYSGTDSKKKKKDTKKEIKENEKRKKKASGPDKLDKWLEDTQEKTLDLMSLTKTDAKKYDLGRTGGLTPDASIKTPDEERDVEEFMEARTKNAENRAMGIKETKDGMIKVDESISLSKTQQFSNYMTQLLNDVRLEMRKEDEEDYELTDKDREEYMEEYSRASDLQDEKLEEFTKMETDWSKGKKDGKLNNMPFLGSYKKSIEGRRENPPPQVEKQYGAPRSPRPDPNGYRNPPNRRVPKD
jgi:hypothetical protein|tara:strand:- start:99 stop:1259 length:1161 start_codon:yes stop_codon:yes gene_type:complete